MYSNNVNEVGDGESGVNGGQYISLNIPWYLHNQSTITWRSPRDKVVVSIISGVINGDKRLFKNLFIVTKQIAKTSSLAGLGCAPVVTFATSGKRSSI